MNDVKPDELLRILSGARAPANSGVDLFTHMIIQHGRHRAVRHLADALLDSIAYHSDRDIARLLPSNLAWPDVPLHKAALRPIELDDTIYRSTAPADTWAQAFSSAEETRVRESVLGTIWSSLGELIVRAANQPKEHAQLTMTTVYQIIAKIHNLGLVPENVYSYTIPSRSTTTQRSPILHLLSSRILTALSDAVWRSHQDDAIVRAASLGVPLKEIANDVPGGRFRLKVRDLGPEVWLEFVLWCCAEGAFVSAGARIISVLSKHAGDHHPWVAIRWTEGGGVPSGAPTIDWDRVRLRHGGTVGLIEGYSKEKPFVEMPARTISAEVVLALVETLINNTVNEGPLAANGMPAWKVQKSIKELVSILPPHGLPSSYFDYLGVRLLQTEAISTERQPDALRSWAQTVSSLRDLDLVERKGHDRVGLDYDSIMEHSEVQAGMLHQSLQAYINIGDVGSAVDTFTAIQKLVDGSKLRAISAFLSTPLSVTDGFFSSRPARQHLEFVKSHGQLPYYKIAAFLNLVTDAKLLRLGDWLLHTEDVDGPVIPPSAYSLSCMAAALTRFAAANDDTLLVRRMLEARRTSTLMPSVNLLRSLANAQISFRDFSKASVVLSEATLARAGGYSPSNVAFLAGSILRLEAAKLGLQSHSAATKLAEAIHLMTEILAGQFDGSRGDFNLRQTKVFRQQVGHLLRIFEHIPNTCLNEIADVFVSRFPTGNEASLAPSTFNTLLDAVVETKGAVEGRRLWDLFCQDPRSVMPLENVPLPGDYVVAPGAQPEKEVGQTSSLVRPSMQRPSIPKPEDYDHRRGLSGAEGQVLPSPLPTAALNLTSESNVSIGHPYIPLEGREARSKSSDHVCITPAVVPNIQTLQIIVRGALTEKRNWKNRFATSPPEPDRLLRWAEHFYKAFGVSKQRIVHEPEQSFRGQQDELTPAQLELLYNEHKQRLGLGAKREAEIATHFNRARYVTKMPVNYSVMKADQNKGTDV